MFMKDARHSGLASDAASVPEAMRHLHEVWRIDLPTGISASPVVADGRLYIAGENGDLYAFDLATRKRLWLYHAEGGLTSTPAVADGRLFVLSRDGYVQALDAKTGALRWRFATGGEARYAQVGGYGLPKEMGPVPDPWDFWLSSPVVSDGRVYVGSSDGHMYALNADDGAKLWAFDAGAAIHDAPALSNGRLVFGTLDTQVIALNAATGAKLWGFKGGVDAQYGVLVGVPAAPSFDGVTVYVGTRDAHLYAFDAATGARRWIYDAKGSWVLTTAAVDADSLYFATSDTGLFVAADKASGAERYRVKTGVWTYASPILIGGRYVAFGAMDGVLEVIDKATGAPVWRWQSPEGAADADHLIGADGKFDAKILFAPDQQLQGAVEKVKAMGAFIASPIWVDDHLIAADANGHVRAFAP
jgi:outer membrane protein assembly factor BamB